MSARARAQGGFSHVMSEVLVSVEFRLVKVVECHPFLLTECLSLSQTRVSCLTVASKLGICLFHCLNRVYEAIVAAMPSQRTVNSNGLGFHIYLFPEGLLTGVCLPGRALIEAIINLTAIVILWEGEARLVLKFVHVIDLISVKS